MTRPWRTALALAALLLAIGVATVRAQDDAPTAIADPQIEDMALPDLQRFVELVTATVGQDTLRLQSLATQRDCLELVRLGNSIALGYQYLGRANAVLTAATSDEEVGLKVRVLQSRVISFAALVRAGEWLGQFCGGYSVPADKADDPRYARPERPDIAMYSRAVIEARQVAEVNLAGAVAAARSGQCPQINSAMQGVRLLVPYLEKLLNDMRSRPQALGPQASRLALQQMRNQLVGAAGQLEGLLGTRCDAAARAPVTPDEQDEEGELQKSVTQSRLTLEVASATPYIAVASRGS